MAFFEAPSPADEPEHYIPQAGPWYEPPSLTFAGILPMNQILAAGGGGAVALTEIRAYASGCWLEITAAVRRPPTRSERSRVWNAIHGAMEMGQDLSPDILRFGVEFADGRRTTTLRRIPRSAEDGPRPEPPVLYQRPDRGSEVGPVWMDLHLGLWLWPLPPPETFDLVLEYPLIGVNETRVPLDGGRIVDAAAESRPFVDL